MNRSVDLDVARAAAERVLELDKAAAPGPMVAIIGHLETELHRNTLKEFGIDTDAVIWSVAQRHGPAYIHIAGTRTEDANGKADAEWFAETRTLAPMLARFAQQFVQLLDELENELPGVTEEFEANANGKQLARAILDWAWDDARAQLIREQRETGEL